MNPHVKSFLRISFYIGALVGVALTVVNASAKPIATTYALVTGAIAVVCLVGAVVVSRRPRY
jgi:hypothetical protein